jgi:HlyD family secretion protein
MNKTKNGNLLAAIGVAALLIFLIVATWVISRPKPVEVQGEVDATQIRVASKLTARIDSLAVHKGDVVKKGQLLFILKSPEIEAKLQQARAALKAAQAQSNKAQTGAQEEDIQAAYDTYLKALAASELAEKTYERVNNLYKEGVVAAQKHDEAETNYKAARETASAAKSIWEKAKKGTRVEDKEAAGAAVANAQGIISEVTSYLNETKVYSPIDGEIANIIAEEGELVSAGYPVVTVVNLKDNWVTFNLREDLLASVRKGSEFEAKIPAIGAENVKMRISYINALGSFATWTATKTTGDFDMKTFEVRATPVDSVSGLRPGMSVLVDWKKVMKANKTK